MRLSRRISALFAMSVVLFAACGKSGGDTSTDAGAVDSGSGNTSIDSGTNVVPPSPAKDSGANTDAGPTCVTMTDGTPVTIATATSGADFVLTVPAKSASATSWGTLANEALILEIDKNGSFLAHLILHQGATEFSYTMHTGALAAGDVISAKVSSLSSSVATKSATACGVTLADVSTFGAMAAGITSAPIYVWPIDKRFDDVPLVVSYGRAGKEYTSFFTNENGGTTALCGGGAAGLAQEIRLWGRSCDIEGSYNAGTQVFERCPNASGTGTLRYEAAHPFLYYGNGHNNLFEDRTGYSNDCGTSSDNEADGLFVGWGTGVNNAQSADTQYAVILRPVPFDADAINYTVGGAPRERVVTAYAPWLFRISGLEVMREGKVDGTSVLDFDRYLHADVYVADVDGPDFMCPPSLAGGGFELRAHSLNDGATDSAGRVTQYSCGGTQWKHVSVPLGQTHLPTDFDQIIFDAYDDDGIYLLAVGDAYIVAGTNDNGATLGMVRKGTKILGEYVDDDSSGCTGGLSTFNGKTYPCVGTLYSFAP